jgi:DNA mismatch endonuclease (patch repair protein)
MSPTPESSSRAALQRMQRQRRVDTQPELRLRRVLHAAGLRYRINSRLPIANSRRTADLVFPKAKVAVFVDGCFWHGCPTHGTWPRANSRWWQVKLEENIRRDRDTDRRLAEVGWAVVRVWEHEDTLDAAHKVMACVTTRRIEDTPK